MITIIDPSRPGAVVDEIASEPASETWRRVTQWRPGRRTVALLIAAQLVILVAVPWALTVAYRNHERVLDEQALQDLRLRLVNRGDFESGGDPSTVALLLRNGGSQPVTLVSARVDREGYTAVPLDRVVKAGDETEIVLPMERKCPTQVLVFGGPTGLLVTLRTSRGQLTTVRVPTRGSAFSFTYFFDQREYCGLFGLTQSLRMNLMSSSLDGKVLTLRLEVANAASLPRSLTGLRGPASLAFTTSLAPPLALVPSKHAVLTPHPVTVRVTVKNCADAVWLLDGGFDPNRPQPVPTLLPEVDERLLPGRFLPTENPSLIDLFAGVSGDGRHEEVAVYLSDELLPLMRSLVATSC